MGRDIGPTDVDHMLTVLSSWLSSAQQIAAELEHQALVVNEAKQMDLDLVKETKEAYDAIVAALPAITPEGGARSHPTGTGGESSSEIILAALRGGPQVVSRQRWQLRSSLISFVFRNC